MNNFNPVRHQPITSHTTKIGACKQPQTKPPSVGLSCLLVNARSLQNKFPEFHFVLQTGNYDLVFVTESWLTNSVSDAMITGGLSYTVIRRDRGSRGGGVAILIRNTILFHVPTTPTNVEGLIVDLGPEVLRIILGYIPNAKDELNVTNMCDFLNVNFSCGKPNLILGDFNMSTVNWDNHSASDRVHHIFFYLCL